MAATGLQIGDWFTNQLGGIFFIFKEYWWAFAIITIGVAAMFWIKKQRAYPIRAVVYERRGDDIFTMTSDRIGRFVLAGLETWQFKKSKDTLPPANYEFVSKHPGSSGIVSLIKYGNSQYKVVDPRPLFTEGKFRVIDVDDWDFKCLEMRARIIQQKEIQELLMRYAPFIGLFLVAGMFTLTIYFGFNYFKDVGGRLCAAAINSTAG